MEFTANPPEFEAAVRAYLEPDREQFNYEAMLHTFLSVERFRQWAAVVRRYRPVRGARFLSSGCGFGGSLVAYRDAGAATVTGVEVDEEYVRLAALRIEGLDHAEVRRYDGSRLPFDGASFDVVESMDVLEHTADPGRYLDELRRVLAPDGLVLLVTPNRLWPVEQHLGITGPPWLPVTMADAVFGRLAHLPGLGPDRRFRYERLRGIRTQNVSLRRLRRLAKRRGLFLQVLPPGHDREDWPLPRHSPWLERLAAHRFGSLVAPVRTLAVTLEHAAASPDEPLDSG
jgi:SAM-dependent methyltransferase